MRLAEIKIPAALFLSDLEISPKCNQQFSVSFCNTNLLLLRRGRGIQLRLLSIIIITMEMSNEHFLITE